MAFRIIRENIINVEADAIVNTANPRPVFGSGTDTAVYEAAGKEELLRQFYITHLKSLKKRLAVSQWKYSNRLWITSCRFSN